MPVLFTNLAVRAGIHLSKYGGKYNAWVEYGTLQKPTLITQQEDGVRVISRRRIID